MVVTVVVLAESAFGRNMASVAMKMFSHLMHFVKKLYILYFSICIVPGCRLGDRGSIPGRGKECSSSLCVQNSSEAHPASYAMGSEGPFPGIKVGRGVTLTIHPT
jgi:hypothetical protein